MNKTFAVALTVAASAYLLTGCGSSSCENGKNPDGTACTQSSGSGFVGSGAKTSVSGDSTGGFGEAHGGGAAGEAGG